VINIIRKELKDISIMLGFGVVTISFGVWIFSDSGVLCFAISRKIKEKQTRGNVVFAKFNSNPDMPIINIHIVSMPMPIPYERARFKTISSLFFVKIKDIRQ